MRATRSTHITLVLVILIIFDEEYIFWPSLVQIFSLAPCSQTPSIHFLTLLWETKLHALQNSG
jgi:hypothetical protein